MDLQPKSVKDKPTSPVPTRTLSSRKPKVSLKAILESVKKHKDLDKDKDDEGDSISEYVHVLYFYWRTFSDAESGMNRLTRSKIRSMKMSIRKAFSLVV